MENDVRFANVLRWHINLRYGPDWHGTVDDNVIKNAHELHALQVKQAALDAITSSVQLSYSLKMERAKQFILYGVTRRLEMIWHAFHDLFSMAYPTRESPLSHDESVQLMADVNLIYLNIRGVLDNLCWALLHEKAPDKACMPLRKVGLFLPCIVKEPLFASIHEKIKEHDAWDRDVKKRRDPAVHQIPLTIIPQFLNSDEAKAYRDLEDDLSCAFAARDFEVADEVLERQRSMGKFHPLFAHDPAQDPVSLYPTIPDDIGHVVELFWTIDDLLRRG